jgi:hypothetical protein
MNRLFFRKINGQPLDFAIAITLFKKKLMAFFADTVKDV